MGIPLERIKENAKAALRLPKDKNLESVYIIEGDPTKGPDKPKSLKEYLKKKYDKKYRNVQFRLALPGIYSQEKAATPSQLMNIDNRIFVSGKSNTRETKDGLSIVYFRQFLKGERWIEKAEDTTKNCKKTGTWCKFNYRGGRVRCAVLGTHQSESGNPVRYLKHLGVTHCYGCESKKQNFSIIPDENNLNSYKNKKYNYDNNDLDCKKTLTECPCIIKKEA